MRALTHQNGTTASRPTSALCGCRCGNRQSANAVLAPQQFLYLGAAPVDRTVVAAAAAAALEATQKLALAPFNPKLECIVTTVSRRQECAKQPVHTLQKPQVMEENEHELPSTPIRNFRSSSPTTPPPSPVRLLLCCVPSPLPPPSRNISSRDCSLSISYTSSPRS